MVNRNMVDFPVICSQASPKAFDWDEAVKSLESVYLAGRTI